MILQEHSSPKNVLTTKKIADYLVAEGLEAPSRNTISSDMAVLQLADPRIKDNNGMGWYYESDTFQNDKIKIPYIFNLYNCLYLVQSIAECKDLSAMAKDALTKTIYDLTYASRTTEDKLERDANIIVQALQNNKYIEFTYLHTFNFFEDENKCIQKRYKRVYTLLAEGLKKNNRSDFYEKRNSVDNEFSAKDVPDETPIKFKVLPQAFRVIDHELYVIGYIDVNTCVFFKLRLMQDIKLSGKAPFDRYKIAQNKLDGNIAEDIDFIDQYILNNSQLWCSLKDDIQLKALKEYADRQNLVIHCHISLLFVLREKYRYQNVNFFVIDDIEDVTHCELHIVNMPFNKLFARIIAKYRHWIDEDEYMAIMSMFHMKDKMPLRTYRDRETNKVQESIIDWSGNNSSRNLKASSFNDALSTIKKRKNLVYGKDFNIGDDIDKKMLE